MSQILIIANTFSVSILFRSSLLRKLGRAGKLKGVYSMRRDYSSLQGLKTTCFYPAPDERPLSCLFRLLRDPKLEILHSFTHLGNVIAIFGALVFRKKAVLTVTGMGRSFNYPGVVGLICRNGIRAFYFVAQFSADAIIVQNQDDYNELHGRTLLPYRLRLMKTAGSGIPLDYFHQVVPSQALKSSKTKVGFFSRALKQKGVEEFYLLAKKFAGSDEFIFVHVGHPGTGKFSPIKIKDTARNFNVEYRASVLDLRAWLLAVDIVVIPSSYREGLSRLLIEAMLAGKVIVARDTTGVRDHLEDGINGFVYYSEKELFATFDKSVCAIGSSVHQNAQSYARCYFDVDKVDSVYFDAYRITSEKS